VTHQHLARAVAFMRAGTLQSRIWSSHLLSPFLFQACLPSCPFLLPLSELLSICYLNYQYPSYKTACYPACTNPNPLQATDVILLFVAFAFKTQGICLIYLKSVSPKLQLCQTSGFRGLASGSKPVCPKDPQLQNGDRAGCVVVYACNPRTWEAEAGRSWVQGHSELHSKILSLKKFF
jgi:hypothetical protein